MRKTDKKEYARAAKASTEPAELAYEYRHGATSYGAFTYTLVSALRRRKQVSFEDLVNEASGTFKGLGYTQHPQILGPTTIVKAQVPWMKRKP